MEQTAGASLTLLQTAFTLCSLSSDSWGFPRYCGSSACKIRMEKGTMEPAIRAELLAAMVSTSPAACPGRRVCRPCSRGTTGSLHLRFPSVGWEVHVVSCV